MRDGGAVHPDEGSRCAVRSPMEGARNQFFFRSSLAEDKNARMQQRNFCHLLQHLAHGFRKKTTISSNIEKPSISFAQRNVLVLQAQFLHLAILDVCSRRIPAHKASLFVAEGVITNEEPTILAVFSNSPLFGLKT